MARITRKDLKTDKFALEVEHTVDFFEEHRGEIIRYGLIALGVVLVLLAAYFYQKRQQSVRERALAQALQVLETPVGRPDTGALSFPTADARDKEAVKRLSEVAGKYSSSDEGAMAEYTLGTMAADGGRLAEAEKRFKDVIASADKNIGSLAKLSLAQIYQATGRPNEAEPLLRDLYAHPTIFVSKEQAAMALARHLAKSKPEEARKLVEPLRASRSAVSQAAIQLYGELTQK